MGKEVKNKSASVRARLFNVSKTKGLHFELLLLRYFQERFLYRLAISDYKESFILKGGLLLVYLNMPKSRPTRDIDFLSNISNDKSKIKSIIKEIISIEIDDGVYFCKKSIKLEDIIEEAKYLGCRVNIEVRIGQAEARLQIDIGFGDSVIPGSNKREITTILDEDKFMIKTYPVEVVISEKFEAMISLALANSRMKDFYDIYMISKMCDIKGADIKKAIYETCRKRKTDLTGEILIFNKYFYNDVQKHTQWNAFIKKLRDIDISFEEIINDLKKFLEPVVNAIRDGGDFDREWDCGKVKWI